MVNLFFMHQALAQREKRNLTVEDGWVYFLHGWTGDRNGRCTLTWMKLLSQSSGRDRQSDPPRCRGYPVGGSQTRDDQGFLAKNRIEKPTLLPVYFQR